MFDNGLNKLFSLVKIYEKSLSFIGFVICIMVRQGHFHSCLSNTSILIFMVIVGALNNNGPLILPAPEPLDNC